MNVADAIMNKDRSAVLLERFWCDCGAEQSVAATYSFTDGHIFLWIPVTPWRTGDTGDKVKQAGHARQIDDERVVWSTAAKCRRCRASWFFTTFPRSSLPDKPGFLVTRFDTGDQEADWAEGQYVDTYEFDPVNLRSCGPRTPGLLRSKLQPTFGRVAP